VRTLRMHLFTLVQLTCLSLLWVVMATAAALAFPFMLLLTIPLRMLLLPRLFSPRELLSVNNRLLYHLANQLAVYSTIRCSDGLVQVLGLPLGIKPLPDWKYWKL
ncbi:hypothetical protein GOODEAATRI_023824, partial [Goodea atripinnis]